MTWLRVSKAKPCRVCGKPDYCTVRDDGKVAHCPRTPSPRLAGDAGYVHWLDGADPAKDRYDWTKSPPPPDLPEFDERIAKLHASHANGDLFLRMEAESLGVSEESLKLLGWRRRPGEPPVASIPMRRWKVGIVGIRYRCGENGRKWAEKGSRSGLFIPAKAPRNSKGLMIFEGPTDTAAGITLGFRCIGRPQAMGCFRLTREAVAGIAPETVAIWADNDASEVGKNGASELALQIAGAARTIVVLQPPPEFKDFRKWINCGATRADVMRRVQEGLRALR